MEGDFFRKEQIYEQTTRLSGYVRTNSATNGVLPNSLQSYNNKELGKTPFNDKERLAIKSMVAEIKPDITIDEIFYS